MNCFECNQPTKIKKHKVYSYEGINLEGVYLLNAETIACENCDSETLILQRVAKLHLAIGLAIVRQPARLSGSDAKFLRRNAGFSLKDWTKRIGIAEATYSKIENSHTSVSFQNDRLIRVNYLNALKQKHGESFHLAEHLEIALSVDTTKHKDFVIAVDVQNYEHQAKYLSPDSPVLAQPETSHLRAATASFSEVSATIKAVNHKPDWANVQNNSQFAMCA